MRKYVVELQYPWSDEWELVTMLKPSWTQAGAWKQVKNHWSLFPVNYRWRVTNVISGEHSAEAWRAEG